MSWQLEEAARAEQVAMGEQISCCEQAALLIMFFSIMIDFPMFLLLMSTFFMLSKFGGSFQDFHTKGTLLSEVSFMLKS